MKKNDTTERLKNGTAEDRSCQQRTAPFDEMLAIKHQFLFAHELMTDQTFCFHNHITEDTVIVRR